MKITAANKNKILEKIKEWGCEVEEFHIDPNPEATLAKHSSRLYKPLINYVTFVDDYAYTTDEIYEDSLEDTKKDAELYGCCCEVTGMWREIMMCPQCKEHL